MVKEGKKLKIYRYIWINTRYKNMRNFLMTLAIALLCAGTGYAQDQIFWEKGTKLKWSDFKGKPKSDTMKSAMTSSGIKFKVRSADGGEGKMKLIFSISAKFSPQRSWVRPGKESKYLLAHEQIHFDIAELFARRLRKGLTQAYLTNSFQTEFKDVYYSTLQDMEQYKKRFNKATNYSRNKDYHKEWAEKIQKELKELTKFAQNKPVEKIVILQKKEQ